MEVALDKVELLEHAEVKDFLRLLAVSRTRSATVGAITELNHAMAVAIGGPGVEPIALHEGHAGKVVGVEAVLTGHVENSALYVRHLAIGNVALGHGPIQRALEYPVLSARAFTEHHGGRFVGWEGIGRAGLPQPRLPQHLRAARGRNALGRAAIQER